MFAGMLPAQPGVGIFVPIVQIAVKLRIFPGAETLFVSLVVFFFEPVVDIVMALIEPLVLPVVAILLMCRCRHREANQYRITQKLSELIYALVSSLTENHQYVDRSESALIVDCSQCSPRFNAHVRWLAA